MYIHKRLAIIVFFTLQFFFNQIIFAFLEKREGDDHILLDIILIKIIIQILFDKGTARGNY